MADEPQPASGASAGAGRFSWRRWRSAAADLLFPPICVLCEAEIPQSSGGVQFCTTCRGGFVDQAVGCHFCGAGLPQGVDPFEPCVHCRGERFCFHTVVRLGNYDGPLQPAILAAKSERQVNLAIQLGALLAQVREAELAILGADAIVAIPAHWVRRGQHGHNPPDAIARQLAYRLQLPVAEQLLIRTRATRPQIELTPKERRANVRGAFAVQPHPDLAGAHLLLVDDVLTTGATAHEAAKTLLQAGAATVAVAVLARATGSSSAKRK